MAIRSVIIESTWPGNEAKADYEYQVDFEQYRRNWIISACSHGSIAELYTLIFKNALIIEPHPLTGCLCDEGRLVS